MKNYRYLFFVVAVLLVFISNSYSIAAGQKTVVYLIPGQGADYRLFKNMQLDSTLEIKHVKYTIPEKDMCMPEYARALSTQIDTTKPYVLVGVSLGGMLATEMNEFLNPEQTILISSAKSRNELPGRYKFQQKVPIYKIIPGKVAKTGAKILQPLVEPDRNNEKETCVNMLNDKDPVFLKRTIQMIMEWERTEYPDHIIHIHGDNDHTIPNKNVNYDYLIEDGSHMMALTRSDEISKIINEILTESIAEARKLK